jgi:hypothetical protein
MLLVLLLSGNGSVLAATGYKCVDTQGKVTYTELPLQGIECTSLGKPPKTSTDPEAAMNKLREQVKAVDEENAATEQTETAAAKSRENCENTRKNIEVLENSAEVVTTDADGNKKILSDEERAVSLQETKRLEQYWCSEQ